MIETYQCPACGRDFRWDDRRDDARFPCPHCGIAFTPPQPTFPQGSIIGDYEIVERIGLGGMGEVYLAKQHSMDGRPVALKVLQEDLAADEHYLQRFYREVRTLAQIEHPNVVKAIEVGFDGRTHYFSMSFVPGRDLKHRLTDQEQFPEAEALRIILNVAQALQHSWARYRLLHRDIKPANIMVTPDGEVKLMDLGISKHMTRKDVELTVTGMMVGSPLYISPEQARADRDLDFRSDMYSLGATFYHLLTGHPPYDHDQAMAIIACHLSEPIPEARALRPELSAPSCQIYQRMMQKRKEERYASWDEAIAEIEFALSALEGNPAPVGCAPAASTLRPPPAASSPPGHRPPPPRWLRIAALMAILGATLFCMQLLVRHHLHERKVQRLATHYRQTVEAMREFSRAPSNKGFEQTWAALIQIKLEAERLGETALASQVATDVQSVKAQAMADLAERRQRQLNLTLAKLKAESEVLEDQGRFDEAILLWQKCPDQIRKELPREVQRHLLDLQKRQRRHHDGLD